MSDDDDPVDPIAALDQGIAGLGTRARVIRAYYNGLVEHGFTDEQTFQLTRDYAAKWSI
jgi:hypothetical protein